jgi:hypothetical protein
LHPDLAGYDPNESNQLDVSVLQYAYHCCVCKTLDGYDDLLSVLRLMTSGEIFIPVKDANNVQLTKLDAPRTHS